MGIFFENKSFFDIFLKLLAALVVIFLVSPLHEFAHGYIAYKLGDTTAKDSGRLTLNPIAHLDVLGAIGIVLFGFGWANPVPIDPRNFKKPRRDMALTAVAGPISNFLAALLGGLILNLIFMFSSNINLTVMSALTIFFVYYIKINIGIGVFNLIPVPPLDGSRIVACFLTERAAYKYYLYQRELSILLVLLLFMRVLNAPLNFIIGNVTNFILWLASLPFGG